MKCNDAEIIHMGYSRGNTQCMYRTACTALHANNYIIDLINRYVAYLFPDVIIKG